MRLFQNRKEHCYAPILRLKKKGHQQMKFLAKDPILEKIWVFSLNLRIFLKNFSSSVFESQDCVSSAKVLLQL